MQAVHNLSKNLIRFGVGLATVGAVVNSALYNVDGGQRAVIFDRFTGVKPDVVGEGTHFLIPWVQKPIVFDIRATPRNVAVVTGSKDLQNVHTTLRILFRPIPEELPKIYTNIGVDYDERILPSITNEVLKAVVAQFDAADMITHRELVSQKVNEELTERAAQFGLLLDDISLTHLSFGKEFTQAVEMKQVAQQEAERARFLVEKAEQMKLAAIIAAEGDAIAAELLGTAFQQSGDALIELRKIEASEEIAAQLAKQKNVTYFPPNLSPLLNIPQQKCEKKRQNGESKLYNSKTVSSGIKYDYDLEAGVDYGAYSEGDSAEVSDFESDSVDQTDCGDSYEDGMNSYADFTIDDECNFKLKVFINF
ncbi:Prohibitin [Trichinella pseudospiralis]|uniref:Prohibitin n=3 Tax=Trichinella pseudospiralis TaxID=6337 RepID=A0A0V1E3D9_TRIPS|nr:Prohibitin [Trichinella pseudospiralis]